MDTTVLGGSTTSRIGFGCARLAGGAGTRASIKLIERMRELGIQHFDVAPSYGIGLAEDVLGDALAGDPDVTITTKVGISRPSNPGLKSFARQMLRPVLAAAPAIRHRLATAASSGASRQQFDPSQVEQSFAESLRRLKRDRVDALLLHEPENDALTEALDHLLQGVVGRGCVGALGSGTDAILGELVPFGTVAQYRWSADDIPPSGRTAIAHGVIRHYRRPVEPGALWREGMVRLGFDPADPAGWPGLLLTLALATLPGGLVLVSSTSANKIESVLAAIDWGAARLEKPGFIETAVGLVRLFPTAIDRQL